MRKIFIIGIAVVLGSCVTYRKCVRKFGQVQSTPITLYDTVEMKVEVPIPGDSLTGTVPCPGREQRPTDNSQPITVNDTLTRSSGRAQVKFWYDKYKEAMNYRVDCLPDTVVVVRHLPVQVKGECPDVVVVDPKNASGLSWFWHKYQVFSGWALLFLVAALLVWLKVKPEKTVMYVEKNTAESN